MTWLDDLMSDWFIQWPHMQLMPVHANLAKTGRKHGALWRTSPRLVAWLAAAVTLQAPTNLWWGFVFRMVPSNHALQRSILNSLLRHWHPSSRSSPHTLAKYVRLAHGATIFPTVCNGLIMLTESKMEVVSQAQPCRCLPAGSLS